MKTEIRESKGRFEQLIGKIEMLSEGRKGADKNFYDLGGLRDYALVCFIGGRMAGDFREVLEMVRAGKIRSYDGAMSYMESRGIAGRFRDLLKLAEKAEGKIRKNLPRNGGIYACKSGEKAVFLNGEKKVLTDDEFEYLKPVVPVWEGKNEY